MRPSAAVARNPAPFPDVFALEMAQQMTPGSTPGPTGTDPANADPHAQARLRLLDLAEDASLYLRRSAEPSVRVAAALLLAASLAACSAPMTSSVANVGPPAVAPLGQEVREGLPAAPGIYPVAPNGLTRDAQGVYGFSWRNADGPATWNQGRASLMRLAQGTADTLELPASGDPILRLRPETAIALPDDDDVSPTPTPRTGTSSSSTSSGTSSGGRSIAWYPFTPGSTTVVTAGGPAGGAGTVAPTTPAYRNPPAAEPGQGSVRGASSSLAAPTASSRTWTSPARAAATGQAGGPGRGTAVSSRSGASDGGGIASGAARPSSSGFSGGRSGVASSGGGSSSSGG